MKTKAVSLAAALCLFALIFPARAGAAVMYYYSTGIVAYIDGMAIPSYNIGGRTAVLVDDLPAYGFKVEWDAAKDSVSVWTLALPDKKPAYVPPLKPKKPGAAMGRVSASAVWVSFNNRTAQAYDIGGKTAVVLEDLADTGEAKRDSQFYNIHLGLGGYSDSCVKTVWDPANNTISLLCVRPGDVIGTDLGQAKILGDQLTAVDYSPNTYGDWTDGYADTAYDIAGIALMDDPDASGYATFYEDSPALYLDAAQLLGELGVQYTFHDGILDITGSTVNDGLIAGQPLYNEFDSTRVLFPLDVSIAVDGDVKISPSGVDKPVAYEYEGGVMVNLDMLRQALGRQLYKWKFALPDGCTERIGNIVTSGTLVYINDMVIPSYTMDNGENYLFVGDLSKYGFNISRDGDKFTIAKSKIPAEGPIESQGARYPETYEPYENNWGIVQFPVYKGIYDVEFNGKSIDNVFIYNCYHTYDGPCISINGFAAAGGYYADTSIPNQIRIYTQVSK